MKHEIRDEGDAIVVALEGDVDLQSSPDARKVLLDCVGKKRPVLVDLSAVGYIDSSGIASLVESLQTAKKSGNTLVLVAVSEGAMRVLQLARLDKVFTICDTVEDGLKQVRSKAFSMAPTDNQNGLARFFDKVGRYSVAGIEEIGNGGVLVVESFFWLILGPRRKQPVRLGSIFAQMMEIGIQAIPIVGLLAAAIGVMLAIQGIHTLRIFGAESRVTIGIAFSVVREFSPLITGILVAGRSGSALAARIGTMKINQEIDALIVMGINPTRFLVVPALLAMLVMVPMLTILSDLMGLLAAGLYVGIDLGISMAAYFDEVRDILTVDDVWHGIGKSVIFAILIAVIGVVNGTSVTGGAEGVGKATTRSVVQAISAIIVTDMIFAFVATR